MINIFQFLLYMRPMGKVKGDIGLFSKRRLHANFLSVCKLRNRFALYLSMKSVYNKIEANILKGDKGCGCSKK